jgi:molecular chaperone Hsp33
VSDHIVRVLAKEAGVRGLACVTTDLVLEAGNRHDNAPAATAALGYGLTGAVLLGALLKIRQRVAIKVAGNGPLGKLVAEADSYGRVRGYVSRPDAALPILEWPGNFGVAFGRQGTMMVVKDLGLQELYESVVPLQSGRLDSDLVYYFMQSEQTPTLVQINIKLNENDELEVAGGLLLQLLPDAEPTTLRTLADRLAAAPDLADALAQGQTPETILAALFDDIAYEILESRPLQFHCSCSWDWAEQALRLLDREDIEQLMAEGEAVVDCHFCHQRYIFSVEALETILEKTAS